MRNSLLKYILAFLAFLTTNMVFGADSLFIYMRDNTVNCFPLEKIDSIRIDESNHTVFVNDTLSFSFSIEEIDTVSLKAPEDVQFSLLHFNDKFNMQLPSNIDCVWQETNGGQWFASVNSIGHYLIPSFKVKDGVGVFKEETQIESKKTSLDFSKPIELSLKDSFLLVFDGKSKLIPYQRNVMVAVNFPSDTATVNRVDINTENSANIISKEEYLNAGIYISDNGVFSGFSDTVRIKGRGNTTWTNTGKKPYRLKFAEKRKPLGLKNGKNWNLLNNYRDSTLMLNATAMKIGQMLGIPYTNNMLPVDLYVNGEYRGNYSFTEKVGLSNNSIDVDETKGAYLLEFDIYLFEESVDKSDETYKDTSEIFHLPFCVNDPDLADYSTDAANTFFKRCKEDLKLMENAVANKDSNDILNHVDMELLAKTFFVYDLGYNNELNWPKSIFFYRVDTTGSPFVMGPLWDFDLAFGQYSKMFDSTLDGWTVVGTPIWPNEIGLSMKGSGFMFFDYLRKNRAFQKAYYEVYLEFEKRMPELFDFIDSYQNYAKASFLKNAEIWGDSGADYASLNIRFKKWLEARMGYVYQHMRNYDQSLPIR